MCVSDDWNESRNSDDVTESEKIQKDLLWDFYQDTRAHARHNETIRSNAINYMLLLTTALLVAISLDGRLNNRDLAFALILILIGLIGMVFAASYAELYFGSGRNASEKPWRIWRLYSVRTNVHSKMHNKMHTVR